MSKRAYFLSADDVAELRDGLRKIRSMRGGNMRHNAAEQSSQSPDVYVVRTPADGIPALDSTGTGSGAGTGGTDKPGSALCDVYELVEDVGELWFVDSDVLVNNFGAAIAGDSWALAKRDKFGKWWVEPISSGPPVVTIVQDTYDTDPSEPIWRRPNSYYWDGYLQPFYKPFGIYFDHDSLDGISGNESPIWVMDLRGSARLMSGSHHAAWLVEASWRGPIWVAIVDNPSSGSIGNTAYWRLYTFPDDIDNIGAVWTLGFAYLAGSIVQYTGGGGPPYPLFIALELNDGSVAPDVSGDWLEIVPRDAGNYNPLSSGYMTGDYSYENRPLYAVDHPLLDELVLVKGVSSFDDTVYFGTVLRWNTGFTGGAALQDHYPDNLPDGDHVVIQCPGDVNNACDAVSSVRIGKVYLAKPSISQGSLWVGDKGYYGTHERYTGSDYRLAGCPVFTIQPDPVLAGVGPPDPNDAYPGAIYFDVTDPAAVQFYYV